MNSPVYEPKQYHETWWEQNREAIIAYSIVCGILLFGVVPWVVGFITILCFI
jgi:hypothetical protein